MNNNAGVVGNAPMTPAFFCFGSRKKRKRIIPPNMQFVNAFMLFIY